MCFAIGSARDTTLVGLATNDEITHTSCQLLIALDQVTDICDYEATVGTSHVHFPIYVDCNRPWQCCDYLMRICVFKILRFSFCP